MVAAAASLRGEGIPRGTEIIVVARGVTSSPCFIVVIIKVGAVPGRGRDGAIPNDIAARLRVKEEHWHEARRGKDGQEPEY